MFLQKRTRGKIGLASVTLNLLYSEIKQMHRELHDLRGALIPTEKISAKEHAELDAVFEEMREGKATPWREALKK